MLSASSALLAGLLAASHVTTVLTIHDPRISESSGLVRSVRHPTLLWTHNDGGSTAEIYGINSKGRTVAQITLRGIDPYDPEAISRGKDSKGRPAIFLGDIGDNGERRRNVSVFRVTEPKSLGRRTIKPTWFRFKYEDGPHDAEALLIDPRDGRLWIATKSLSNGGLYVAPRKLVTQSHGINRLRRVADVPPLTTDATFLPNGKFVLRTYSSGFLYDAPGQLREELTLPIQPQAESVAYDGKRLLLGSEGPHSLVLAVALPSGALGESTPTPTPSATATSRPFSLVGGSFGLDAIARVLIAMVAASMLVFIVARLRRDR
ncbi:MAG: hypothetical protein QOI25_4096 [Mycobacterium sp.]|nr:hypothetical protein [Mycobacterium sp.]